MADQPRKVGVYDDDAGSSTRSTADSGVDVRPGRSGGVNWWIVALVVVLLLIAVFVLF